MSLVYMFYVLNLIGNIWSNGLLFTYSQTWLYSRFGFIEGKVRSQQIGYCPLSRKISWWLGDKVWGILPEDCGNRYPVLESLHKVLRCIRPMSGLGNSRFSSPMGGQLDRYRLGKWIWYLMSRTGQSDKAGGEHLNAVARGMVHDECSKRKG